MSYTTGDTGKTYSKEATGDALETVLRHREEELITLFGSAFCPFVQRAWVALEVLGLPYEYHEVDPYMKPDELLELSPKGLVPALKLHHFTPPKALNESTVILEYLNDSAMLTSGRSLLPAISEPYARALVRLQADHVNRVIVPSFYRYLQAQDETAKIQCGKEFTASLDGLVVLLERAEHETVELHATKTDQSAPVEGLGVWSGDGQLNLTDIMVGPWLHRASVVLKKYRGFEMPTSKKFTMWVERVLGSQAFKATLSTEALYIDSYERYAFNRPNTSQVANAINAGRPLP